MAPKTNTYFILQIRESHQGFPPEWQDVEDTTTSSLDLLSEDIAYFSSYIDMRKIRIVKRSTTITEEIIPLCHSKAIHKN